MTVFFLIAGLGYGNAARQLAVIEELRQKNDSVRVVVFSWGNGFDFLQAHSTGLELKRLGYFDFRVSSYLLKLAVMIPLTLLLYPLNSLYLFLQRLKYRPKTVVFDSDYHFLSFLGGVRRLSVNQVPDVHKRGQSYGLWQIWQQGYFLSFVFEKLDFFLQRTFCHKILCPCLISKKFSSDKVQGIGLIVRRSFRVQSPIAADAKPGVLLSGSGVRSKELMALAVTESMAVISKNSDGIPDTSVLLEKYNPILTQGGLSSISEVLSLGRDLKILPIPHHWEQFLNAAELNQISNKDELKFDGAEQVAAELIKP